MCRDINELLHSERGVRLAQMPRANILLSAGCAGAWYFDWISEKYGQVEKHIGLEFYMPRPENLPANVEWIANTVADMHDVRSSSVDLIFSGQNLEHVWPDEAISFFIEASRVTRPAGHLVVDSPNRLVTQKLGWSHPEHTVEFTPVEASRAIASAGFDVTAIEGIWLGIDPATGIVLPHAPSPKQAYRIQDGRSDPENAFIWWIEARRADREPNVVQLSQIVNDVFARAWPERKLRWSSQVGTKRADGVTVDQGQVGAPVFGPYMPLPSGRYSVEFWCVDAPAHATIGHCDVTASENVTASTPLVADAHGTATAKIDFSLHEMTFGLQFRIFSNGGNSFHALWPELKGAEASDILQARKQLRCTRASGSIPNWQNG